MKDKKYSSEGLDLFTMLLAGLYKQANDILKNLDEYVEEEPKQEVDPIFSAPKKGYVAPCAKVTVVDKSDENDNEPKYPRFEYYAVEDATNKDEEKYEGINDDSPIDKRMKDILDRLVFKIRTNYLGEVEYIVKIDFGKTVHAHFEWHIEHDRFEGSIKHNDVVTDHLAYVETDRKFYVFNGVEAEEVPEDEACDCECCDEQGPCTEEKKESVKFDANESNGAQIKVEEFAEKENVAEYLYRRLNADNQNKINEALSEVEIAVNRIVDYRLYTPCMNSDGIIDTIVFPYCDIENNFRQILPSFNEIPENVVLEHIQNKFGFKDVKLDAEDKVICTLK